MDNIPSDAKDEDSRATPPKPGGRDPEEYVAPSLGGQNSGGVFLGHEARSLPSVTQVEATGVNTNKQVRSRGQHAEETSDNEGEGRAMSLIEK